MLHIPLNGPLRVQEMQNRRNKFGQDFRNALRKASEKTILQFDQDPDIQNLVTTSNDFIQLIVELSRAGVEIESQSAKPKRIRTGKPENEIGCLFVYVSFTFGGTPWLIFFNPTPDQPGNVLAKYMRKGNYWAYVFDNPERDSGLKQLLKNYNLNTHHNVVYASLFGSQMSAVTSNLTPDKRNLLNQVIIAVNIEIARRIPVADSTQKSVSKAGIDIQVVMQNFFNYAPEPISYIFAECTTPFNVDAKKRKRAIQTILKQCESKKKSLPGNASLAGVLRYAFFLTIKVFNDNLTYA